MKRIWAASGRAVFLLGFLASFPAHADCQVPQSGAPIADPSGFRLGVLSVEGTRKYIDELRKTVAPCPAPWKCDPIHFSTTVQTAGPPYVPGGALPAPLNVLPGGFVDPLFVAAWLNAKTPEWATKPLSFEHTVSAEVRAGYLPENPKVPFRGNVLYYEGLGDSMLNHETLFKKLTDSGYRVIAFDYMGQGGSTGDMDDTRIKDIPKIGALAWEKFARDRDSRKLSRTIVGWSTGGLAAFSAAHDGMADKVVLIAPGIAPKSGVGETNYLPFKVDGSGIHRQKVVLDRITPESLDSQGERDAPMVEPVRPGSPLYVSDFALDLQRASERAQKDWKISRSVCGFTLLSGKDDTYVDPALTRKVLKSNAPQFEVTQYPGTLHEIHDDLRAPQAKDDITSFIGKDCPR